MILSERCHDNCYYYFFVQLGFNCGPEARVDTGVMLDPVLFGATVGFEF